MRRTLTLLLTICLGLGLLALGVVIGLSSPPTTASGAPAWLSALVGLLVVVLSAWKLLRRPGDEQVAPAPWTPEGALVETRPEETPDTDRISGTAFTEHIEAAAADARREDTVDAGLTAIRTPLQETLVAVLEQGGWDESRIDRALAEGSWTDDPVAAAVVDERVSPPVRSLRRGVWAWLFPEKAVRHRAALTVGAIAGTADEVLPPVVGQHAPRPVPIVEPTVEDLRRAADGSLRRAVEGQAAVQSPVAEPGAEQTDDSGWDDHTGNGQTSNDWSGPDEETAEVGSDTDTAVTRDEENTASDAAEEDTDEGAWQFTGGEG
jgi:hypothetical protein